MTDRRTIVLAALALSLPITSAAADITAEAGTKVAGVVVASTESVSLSATLSISEHVLGTCIYVGITTLDGRIMFVFGGIAVSYSRSISQPQATQINCRFVSPNQPGVAGSEPTFIATSSRPVVGAVAVTVGPTPSLQLRPVSICVSGLGVFGPIPPPLNPVFLAETCSTTAINI